MVSGDGILALIDFSKFESIIGGKYEGYFIIYNNN